MASRTARDGMSFFEAERLQREHGIGMERRDFAHVLVPIFHVGSIHWFLVEPDYLERIRGATDDEHPLVGARRIMPTTR